MTAIHIPQQLRPTGDMFILVGRTPVREHNFKTWSDWMQSAETNLWVDFSEPGIGVHTAFTGQAWEYDANNNPYVFYTRVGNSRGPLHDTGSFSVSFNQASREHHRLMRELSTVNSKPTTDPTSGAFTMWSPMISTQPIDVFIREQEGACDEGR